MNNLYIVLLLALSQGGICWDANVERITAQVVGQWAPLARQVAIEFDNVDADLLLGVIAKESLGNPTLISADAHGSVGLMQILPNDRRPPVEWLLVPYNNIELGARILSQTIDYFDGDVTLGLAAYNCGYESLKAGRCIEGGGLDYAHNILTCWVPILQAHTDIDNFMTSERDAIGH
jgi:soluble lytic murein transglycosylase-like protein